MGDTVDIVPMASAPNEQQQQHRQTNRELKPLVNSITARVPLDSLPGSSADLAAAAAAAAAAEAPQQGDQTIATMGDPQAGDSLADTTTSEQPFATGVTIPADLLMVHDVVLIRADGVYTTGAVAPKVTIRVKVNGTTIAATSAMTIPGLANPLGWMIECRLAADTVGAAGQLDGSTRVDVQTAASVLLPMWLCSNALWSFDTTAPLAVTITAQFGSATSNASLKMRSMVAKLERVG